MSSMIPLAPPQYVKLTATGRRVWDCIHQAYSAHSLEVYKVEVWEDGVHPVFLKSTRTLADAAWIQKEYCIPVEYIDGNWRAHS